MVGGRIIRDLAFGGGAYETKLDPHCPPRAEGRQIASLQLGQDGFRVLDIPRVEPSVKWLWMDASTSSNNSSGALPSWILGCRSHRDQRGCFRKAIASRFHTLIAITA